jgi:hypothetical protein
MQSLLTLGESQQNKQSQLMKPFELVGWWFLPIQDNSWFKRLTT